jgi:glycosyltransferase involved in cell wall biosynthesis
MSHFPSSAASDTPAHWQPLHVVLTTHACGGHEIMLLEWLSHASQALGVPVTLHMKPIKELLDKAQSKGLRIELMDHTPHRKFPILNLVADIRQTRAVLKKIPLTAPVLFAPGIVQASPWHLWVAGWMGYKTIAYVPMAHPSAVMSLRWPALRDWLVGHAIKHVAHWITITEQQKTMLREVWHVRTPVHVIPNKLSKASPMPNSAPRLSDQRRLRVLFLGRFDRNQKGLDWLVQTLHAQAPKLQQDFEFVFQGQGPYQPSLEQLALAHPEFVQIWPWGEAAQAFAQVDVLMLCSRFEGFPLVAIEAALHGVPVMASDRSGLSDVLPADGVFPFGDITAWLACLQTMKHGQQRAANTAYMLEKMASLLSQDTFAQRIKDALLSIQGQDDGRIRLNATR